MEADRRFNRVYHLLIDHYGSQHWWPGDTPFEVMVGAILTQNTAWTNVEKAISALKQANCLQPEVLVAMPAKVLAQLIHSSGYFNVKAARLQYFCRWYLEQGGYESLAATDTAVLRTGLLAVKGIGPETADDILLYAFERPVFVIDAYTRRLFSRLGLVGGDESYENLRNRVEAAVSSLHYNEYHALIVRHAKGICNQRPRCPDCCLNAGCPVPESSTAGPGVAN